MLLIGVCPGIFAQDNVITVSGKVIDAENGPVIGANVFVKNAPGLGVITDMNGMYTIKVELYSTLIFSFVGMEEQEIIVEEGMTTINVKMEDSKESVLDEVVVTGMGAQRKVTLTGAVSTVDVNELKVPTSSVSNALAGVVPGIIARQTYRTARPEHIRVLGARYFDLRCRIGCSGAGRRF